MHPIRRATHVPYPFAVVVDAAAAFFARRGPATYAEQALEDDGVTFRIVVDGRFAENAAAPTFAGLLSIRRSKCGAAMKLRGACAAPALANDLEEATVVIIRTLLDDLVAFVRSSATSDGERTTVVSLDRRRRERAAYARERQTADSS